MCFSFCCIKDQLACQGGGPFSTNSMNFLQLPAIQNRSELFPVADNGFSELRSYAFNGHEELPVGAVDRQGKKKQRVIGNRQRPRVLARYSFPLQVKVVVGAGVTMGLPVPVMVKV